MIEYPLNGYIILVDDEDGYLLRQWNWYIHKTKHTFYVRGYPIGNRKGGLFYMHKIILGNVGEVDHENGNGLDNRRSNIRIATRSQNNANRYTVQSRSSQSKGVHWESSTGRWRAEITKDGVRYRLGRFNSQEEAAIAYHRKAQELFSEFGHVAFRDTEISAGG